MQPSIPSQTLYLTCKAWEERHINTHKSSVFYQYVLRHQQYIYSLLNLQEGGRGETQTRTATNEKHIGNTFAVSLKKQADVDAQVKVSGKPHEEARASENKAK